jgi:D-alanyl-D-alanine carboxypeptidase
VANTNRRLLDSYQGADGIKTGYTVAAGYNLVASAQRGDVRIIATVFGGTSTAQRNQVVAQLLDAGFAAAPLHAELDLSAAPTAAPTAVPPPTPANVDAPPQVTRESGLVAVAPRPPARPREPEPVSFAAVAPGAIEDALAEALAAAPSEPQPELIMTAAAIAPEAAPLLAPEPEMVTRVSTSGGHHWGISLGAYPSRDAAERALIQVALAESATLDGGLRRVDQRSSGFDASIMGLTREGADLACRRLAARGTTCFMLGTEEG